MKRLISSFLNYPREILLIIDEKFGIEVFKLAVVFSVVYAVQGMGGLSDIPLLFYFKDVLKFSEDQMQNFSAITMFAWLIKPLFGYISDRLPIAGYRRKSYMILMALVAASSWWILAWMTANGCNRYAYLVLIFNFSSLGYAFVDVVCDGLMVEKGQALKKENIFVNIQWFSLGIAGFLTGFFSGQLQHAVKNGAIPLSLVFIIVGVIPLITSLIAWIFVKEDKIKTEAEKSPASKIDSALFKEILTSKVFWLLSAFIFFWKYSPSFGAVFQYYAIDIMKFDEIFLGKINAIGNAIFPFSILLYAGMLKYLPWVKTKHYLYASVIIGLVYSAISWLFYLPEPSFNWVRFNLTVGNVSAAIALPLIFLGIWTLFSCRRKAAEILRKSRFFAVWLIITPLSLLASLWFADLSFSPFILSYRSLTVVNSVTFGYASIASFLIPLALAAKLAPKKAEGTTYAYFMALSNISGSFLPSITGAQVFKVLKRTLLQPETVIAENLWHSLLIAVLGLCLLTIIILLAVKIFRTKITGRCIFSFPYLARCCALIFAVIAVYHFAPTFLCSFGQLKVFPAYFIQQSYFAFQPFIGNADWLGKEAYRALILRYATIIGALFTVISAIFVYLLSVPEKE